MSVRTNSTHGTINDFAHQPLSVRSKRETETTCPLFLSKKQPRNRVPQFIHHCSLLHHREKTKRLQDTLLPSTILAPPVLSTSYVYCAGLLPPMSTYPFSVGAFLGRYQLWPKRSLAIVLPNLANTNFGQTKFGQHQLLPKPLPSLAKPSLGNTIF